MPLFLLGPLAACTPDTAVPAEPPPRVLLVLADDLGIDALNAYADVNHVSPGERPYPTTPTIDRLCTEGIRFTRAWAAPMGTPTRGMILTGRYGFRTGLDSVASSVTIHPTETTLPRVLDGVTTGMLGKWQLGRDPNQMGWTHYAGALDTLDSYIEYDKTVNGTTSQTTRYPTTDVVDDALAWIGARSDQEPWLLWLGFHAPHAPFHTPPAPLHRQGTPQEPALKYDAMIEALDTELGRLMTALPEGIDVIFVGDNGSPARTRRAPHLGRHAKGTLYEGGVHVPLCAMGPQIATDPRTEAALVSTVDLFATIVDLHGAPLPVGLDSESLVPLFSDATIQGRAFTYTESRTPDGPGAGRTRGGRAVRNERYKLIAFEDGSEGLYDLEDDPLEATNLVEQPQQIEVLTELRTALSAVR